MELLKETKVWRVSTEDRGRLNMIQELRITPRAYTCN